MHFYVGTSGFSYPEWKGSFYPEGMKDADMLGYFATRLSAVEINNTFYRMPNPDVLEAWGKATPPAFRFVIKMPRYIVPSMKTEKLSAIPAFFERIKALEDKLGPSLLLVAPFMKNPGPERLGAFLEQMPKVPLVYEFRNDSWYDPTTEAMLKERNIAQCWTDSEERDFPHRITSDILYARLRRPEYTDDALKEWIGRMKATGAKTAYVFFKHEDAGTGPKLAARFSELADKSK